MNKQIDYERINDVISGMTCPHCSGQLNYSLFNTVLMEVHCTNDKEECPYHFICDIPYLK
ncbi:hypothetical protein NUACC26_086650 [Scytonema sp. NUACC26]